MDERRTLRLRSSRLNFLLGTISYDGGSLVRASQKIHERVSKVS
jgi:hypothetical protein